jgi:hypothetical protein
VNEREWFTVVDAPRTLARGSERASDRKLRLFAIACCRRLAHHFAARFAAALAEAEALADETPPKARRVGRAARRHDTDLLHALADPRTATAAWLAAERAIAAVEALGGMAWGERAFHAACPIDLIGNPFRPPQCAAEWRAETARALAHQFYARGEPASLPNLADALEEAGRDDEQVLAHCRDIRQPHVRGCWVVDLVLGRD